jgi:hypothetical protein
MKQQHQNYLVINGKTYDARSGLVVKDVAPAMQSINKNSRSMSDVAPAPRTSVVPKPKITPVAQVAEAASTVVAKKVHRQPQKAQTLLRNSVQRPEIIPASHARVGERKVQEQARVERASQVSRTSQVSRFATSEVSPQPVTLPAAEETKPSIALAQFQSQHPALKKSPAEPAPALKGSELKEQLIRERLEETPDEQEEKLQRQEGRINSFFSKQPRLLTAAVSALSVLLLVGYVTYLNMPTISMRIAANRAGFAATMPGYKPAGYSLHGPVAYSPGEVNLAFNSNTNADSFTLAQHQTNWDAQALLDNYVSKQTNDYLTYQEKGLTIYIYDGKAAWVNGGVWYNVGGTAKLSSDQILQMATSM